MIVRDRLLNYKDSVIYQDTEFFKMSLDSVLLANFVKINLRDKNIIDLATGNAPIPMILTYKTKATIYGVELQEVVYNLGKISINENNMKDRVKLINDDIKNLKNYFESGKFDVITCNPPYFKTKNSDYENVNLVKSLARHEKTLNLDDLFDISRYLLKNNGRLAIVHRTERLLEILETAKKYNLEIKRMRFVYPNKEKNSDLVLLEFVLNGKPGLKLLPPLFVYEKRNVYSEELKSIFGEKIQ